MKSMDYAFEFPEGSWLRRAAIILAETAQGKENARTKKSLVEQLWSEFPTVKDKISENSLQHKVIIPSRRSGTGCFICMCGDGYYIPMTRKDAQAAMRFYKTRIAKEKKHLMSLEVFAETLPD